jgi:hypothetical protein
MFSWLVKLYSIQYFYIYNNNTVWIVCVSKKMRGIFRHLRLHSSYAFFIRKVEFALHPTYSLVPRRFGLFTCARGTAREGEKRNKLIHAAHAKATQAI